MPTIPRRRFLQSCAGALAASASTLFPRVLSASTEPNLTFPSAPHERLAVPSWPFRGYIVAPLNQWARDPKLPGMDLKDFAAMVVKRFNVRNIEPLSEHFSSTEASYLKEFRASVRNIPSVDAYDGPGKCILSGETVDRRVVIAKSY